MAHENTILRKQLNKIQFVGLKGIKVGDALAIDTWHFQEWTKEIISNFEFMTIPEYDCRVEGKKVDKAFIISFPYIKRTDQMRKFNMVYELFDNKAVITAQEKRSVKNPYLWLIPLWYIQMCDLEYSSIVRYGICYILCKALGQVSILKRMIEKYERVKKIICFSDLAATDNIFVQMCNQKKYITYTLQHGIINGTYDYVEYKCSYARYFLVWGEYTKWMAMKYGMQESKIKVVGSMDQLNEANGGIVDRKVYNCFLVCTNGVDEKSAWNRNKEIIMMANQLAEKYSMVYYLRVHPYDKSSRYKHIVKNTYCVQNISKIENISDTLEKVDFTLCGNSTTFCDALYHGVPAFRYITYKDRKIDVCKGIRFGRVESYEKLETEIEALKRKSKVYQEESIKVKKFLFCTGYVHDKYKQAIEGT